MDTGTIRSFGKRLVKEAGEDDLSGAAAELAYRFFLALFPFFIFLAALGGFAADIFGIQDPTKEVMDLLGNSLPEDANSVLRGQLDNVIGQTNPALLSIGIIGAIWSAASGIGTIMKVSNRTYDVKETRPIWKRYALSVGLTVLGGFFIVLALALLLAGQLAGSEISDEIGLSGAFGTFLSIVRWPVIFAFLLAAVAFLYWATPNVQLPFRWISPGAVVFVIAWTVFTVLFAFYVSNFSSYNATYGALGGVVVLLVWFYMTSFILMLGAEINAVLVQEVVPEELPQTEEEGATRETVPDEKEAEAAAKNPQVREPSGTSLTAQERPHR
jgi:membrane protein